MERNVKGYLVYLKAFTAIVLDVLISEVYANLR